MDREWALASLRTGRTGPLGNDGATSAIAKRPVAEKLVLTPTGLAGDEQADRRHHGGPEKAVHHYPAEHYECWRERLPDIDPTRFETGGFGENLSTRGLTEATVCIGDRFGLGTAVIEVSQARQPCWKLNLRFGRADMAEQVQQSGMTGWYYRVIEPGQVSPDDRLTLLERPQADWPLARILDIFYHDPLNAEALARLAELVSLSDSWRGLAARRLETGRIEDFGGRIRTPAPYR